MALPPKPSAPNPRRPQGILGNQLTRQIAQEHGQLGQAAEPPCKSAPAPAAAAIVYEGFKFMSSSKFVVQIHYTAVKDQRSLTIGHDGTIVRVPVGPFDVEDFSAMLVALTDGRLSQVQRTTLFEHLAFSVKAFSPRVLGMLVEHLRRNAKRYPKDALQKLATALDAHDPKAAKLLRRILAK